MTDSDRPWPLTRAEFARQHPRLFAELRREFLAQGAAEETARIRAVLGAANGQPHFLRLAARMAFDGKSTPADVTTAMLAETRIVTRKVDQLLVAAQLGGLDTNDEGPTP